MPDLRRHPRIGFLLSWFGERYNQAVFSSAVDTAREKDISLICFEAGRLQSPYDDGMNQILCDLVNEESLDGLVIFSEGIDQFVNPGQIRDFIHSRYDHRLPIVSIGEVEGIPSIATDLQSGMYEEVTHLIEVHGYQRIAFIHGPETQDAATALFDGYAGALAHHGIPVDPQLVTPPGVWGPELGSAAIRKLLDERNVSFDAIIGGDPEAVGAINELRRRGIRVPNDIAVAGYNDIEIARFSSPPLTTVYRPIENTARKAIDMLLRQLSGEQVQDLVRLPTKVVIRRSCGCIPDFVNNAAIFPNVRIIPEVDDTSQSYRQEQFLQDLIASFSPSWVEDKIEIIKKLPDIFFSELNGSVTNEFITVIEDLLRSDSESGSYFSNWQKIISDMRRNFLPNLFEDQHKLLRAENIFHQVRVLIWSVSEQARSQKQSRDRQYEELLREVNRSLITSFDLSGLIKILALKLPLLGISSCYLSLYMDPNDPLKMSKLVFAYHENERLVIDENGILFPTGLLIPDRALGEHRSGVFLVEPLFFGEEQLGFIIFEVGPQEGYIYSTLRDQISSAVKGALLNTHNIELYNDALQARKVAEEANRLKSRFLSMVSHELRTPISLIVGTVDMMEYQQNDNTSSDFRRDIASIKAGAQHLSLLIGDVLDLTKSHAGELRLTYEPVHLQKIVNDVCLLAEPLAREKGLSWEIEIPGQIPVVLGDRVRLSQVLLNLVSNAIKFTDQGSVNLKIQPGSEMISILVCDTGLGIPEVEQEKIFDEFWQSERTIQFGWGGMGLGLAISKKLVELHGGTIGVRSSGIHGTGSTFFFTLPIMKETISPLPEENERSKTVLLLTENPDRVELVSEFLLGRGFEVDVLPVHNEIDWITGVINSPPGAIVLDFEPAFDRGWDLMRILKENRHTQNIPVVFFSLLEKKSGGAILEFDYLTKPIGSAELARAIKRHGISSKSRQDTLILVVEDDPPLLDLHVRVIQSHFPDCQLLKARNGREALDVMQINPPDLVILDLMMPEIDGFGVIENMRNHEHTRNIPIIVITAQILTCQEMDRLQHGVAAVLGKGVFSVDEVLSQIETALCKNKQLGCQAQQVVRQAMAFIHEHYSEQITRDDLAKYVAVSPRYLTRCFREETGLTPITYLNRYRMNRAKYLLEKGDKTITEVAIAVGFSNSNYFGRVFHREVGVSPSEYHLGRRPD